jgi:hypothetical protein
MTYEDSESAFAKATEADPDCAMGYWGQAMTIVHPLWSDPPSEARFESGRALVEKARARAGSDHELAYVDALAAYYEAGRGDSEKPNLVAFEEGWRGFQEMYPGDPEGKAFYALAQLGTVDPVTRRTASSAWLARWRNRCSRQFPITQVHTTTSSTHTTIPSSRPWRWT